MLDELHNFGKGLNHLIDLRSLPSNPFIVDAGACIGAFCNAMTELVPDCEILAVEPSRKNLPQLRLAVKNLTNVTLVEKAITAFDGEIEMHDVYGENGKYYQWASTHKNLAEKAIGRSGFIRIDSYKTPAVCMDTLTGKRRIDYLKMDIEGAEEEVLLTMTAEQACFVSQLSCECHGAERQIEQHLQQLGFKTVYLEKEHELYARRKH